MKVIVQNLAIEYEDEGQGPVMLFLHGWQDNLHTFDSLAPFFTSAQRVIRLDLPGFGKSQSLKGAWDLDNYVQFVSDFIQKLNIRVDALLGHSFGGRIAIKGAAARKFLPNKIILIGSAGLAKRRTLRNLVSLVLTKIGGLITYLPPLIFWRKQLRKRLYDFLGSDYLEAGPLKETFLKIISEDLSQGAKNLNIPTLLIWGENDAETPLKDGQKLSELIYGSELKVIAGAGHFVHREKPDQVVKFIKEFL